MPSVELIMSDNAARWEQVLARMPLVDVYHSLPYHRLGQLLGEGEPCLFFYEEGSVCAAFPMLLREIPGAGKFRQWRDATSVYGYPGPLVSTLQPDTAFAQRFQTALRLTLHEHRVVCVFSRLHPMIASQWLLEGIAKITDHGPTVWINLTESEEQQMSGASQEHRRHLRKAYQNGLVFREDETFAQLNHFVSAYEETMRRNQAVPYYFFPPHYYRYLATDMRSTTRLFVAEREGKLVSSTMAFVTGQFVQFHLNGTPTQYLELGCVRFLLDQIRKWGKTQGYQWLNLGGGVSAQSDTLLRFKGGFSRHRRAFMTARLILEPDVYAELVSAANSQRNAEDAPGDYFPAYRK